MRERAAGWIAGLLELLLQSCLPARGPLLAGRRHGLWTRRAPDGRILDETTWVRGVRHGPTTRYYLSGRKRWVGSWLEGRREGEWFFFRRDGRMDPARTGNYADGLRFSGIKGFNDWNT
jgi:antitoxin component YwqK of YwqJK toxin-antitoxin module